METSGSVAERLSNWWVAQTIPGKTLTFSQRLANEHYVPMDSNRRPIAPYVFVRAAEKTNAWMCPGFRGWIMSNGRRATVANEELVEFRSFVEVNRIRKPVQHLKCRVLLRVNAAMDLRS